VCFGVIAGAILKKAYGFETGSGFSIAWFVRVIETL
jgi:hypothetical protein